MDQDNRPTYFLILLETKMSGNLIENFKILNRISNYGRHFWNSSLPIGNLLSRLISKTKSTDQLDFLLIK